MNLNYLPSNQLVAVVEIQDDNDAVPLCEALLNGGITAIEITLRTPSAFNAIKRIVAHHLPITVGAGTILNLEHLKQAEAAGAMFYVSPVSTLDLLTQAKVYLGKHTPRLIPGVATPTEALTAYELGYLCLKLFPAEVNGGVSWLNAIAGPLPQLRFMPTGGIQLNRLNHYLQCPNVIAVGGTWIAPKTLINEKKWATITNNAKTALETIASINSKQV